MGFRQDDYIREATLKICSSLDMETALKRCYDYIRKFFPLDGILLYIHDAQMGVGRRIAHAISRGLAVPADTSPFPRKVWSYLVELPSPLIIDSSVSEQTPVEVSGLMKNRNGSMLVMPLDVEGYRVGVIFLRSVKDCVYQEKHAQFAKSLSDPFSVALANSLAHKAVLQSRDILLDDKRFFQKELAHKSTDEIIGGATGLKNVMEMVRQVAPLNNTVLLLGETGVGKEVIANAIHLGSPRKNAPLIKVNCGAIPETLIDSELFGHEKGAFSGALTEKRGRFERANGGTIFLDEIGELPLQAQVRLLRILQSRELERVGGTKPIPVDIRIIAATHRNLEQMISEKLFREDLWFRINGFPIFIPPLRQRKEDIPALMRHLIHEKCIELGLHESPAIEPGAMERLVKYDWPGNVRELQNVVERELICNQEGTLSFESLLPVSNIKEERGLFFNEQDVFHPLKLDEAVERHIRNVLAHTKGRINGKNGAAELLGINPSTLRSRMKKLGLERCG
jgi:transcriptional regulator with GAF, ATPase, and Fis domain